MAPYFPDLEAILAVWHARQINAHLEQLTAIREPLPPRPIGWPP